MSVWFFATDLHGRTGRYERLFDEIVRERPEAVLLGGDLLPFGHAAGEEAPPCDDFISDYLLARLEDVRSRLGGAYPQVLLILGNDDPRALEPAVFEGEARGLWRYAHRRKLRTAGFDVYGYACVPPTPFLLKDWERHDVSRYVDPGCVSPEEGRLSVSMTVEEMRYGTIQKDLDELTRGADLSNAIFLFHTPPYDTPLDRADLDGRIIDHVPVDVHVGSIAVRRFIEARQPRLSLHGHIHEATRLTGLWLLRLGRTICLGGAHDGPELALVRFDPAAPGEASRRLLPPLPWGGRSGGGAPDR